jgi:hypothetical protein
MADGQLKTIAWKAQLLFDETFEILHVFPENQGKHAGSID